MTIGEVASRAGIAPSAIRFYEREGLLPPAERVNGRREFDGSVLDRLAVIQLARRAGFTLSEIRTLMTGFAPATPPSERWRSLAAAKLEEVNALIARGEEMRALLEDGLACGCLTTDACAVLRQQESPAAAQPPPRITPG